MPSSGASNARPPGEHQWDPNLRVLAYTRQSTKDQTSIPDQDRVILEWLARRGLSVRPENIYVDEQSGQEDIRPGWQMVRERIRSGEFDLVIGYSQSRMFRDLYEAVDFSEEIRRYGVRCVFAAEDRILNEDDSSQQFFEMQAVIDQQYARGLANHVRTSQETLFLNGMVSGTVSFGYEAQPVPGPRTDRPRCKLAVSETDSSHVRTAFRLCDEGMSIASIIKEFNVRGIPVPSNGRSRCWTRTMIRKMLSNPRYIGDWSYGVKKNIRIRGRRKRGVKRKQPLRTLHFEHLRIIDDSLFYRVQQRLAAHKHKAGRRPKDGDHKTRPRALNGFYVCPKHDRSLIVAGLHGRYMECPECKRDSKPALVSLLPRERSLNLICQALADAAKNNVALRKLVVQKCREAEAARNRPDVSAIDGLRRQIDKLTQQISFIRATSGNTDFDRAEGSREIAQAQGDRLALQSQLAEIEANAKQKVEIPSRDEVEERIDDLCYTLERAGQSDRPADLTDLRRIIELLTGGRIVVTQQGNPNPKGGWLRLTFRSRLLSYLLGHYGVSCVDDEGSEIVIDVRRELAHERIADEVKRLAGEGWPTAKIAKEFGRGKSVITAALKHWHVSRGLEPPDYRSLRSRLKQREAPKYQRIAEEASRLADTTSMLIDEIAEQVHACPDTTAKAINWWRQDHNLPKVDFRHRRKEVMEQRRRQKANRDRDDSRSAASS